MMLCRLMVIAVLGFTACCATRARGDFFLQFADVQGISVTQFPTIQVGQSFDVYVYYVQSSGTLATDEGLFSAAFRLDYGADPGHVSLESDASIQLNTIFDNPFSQVARDSGGADLDLANPAFQPGVFGPVSDPNRLFLAKFQLTGVSVGAVQLGFRDLDPETEGFVTGNFGDLDSLTNFSRTASLNVVATPEPGSVMLLLVGSGVLTSPLVRRWRERRRSPIVDSLPSPLASARARPSDQHVRVERRSVY